MHYKNVPDLVIQFRDWPIAPIYIVAILIKSISHILLNTNLY